ncbi:MAG: putative zinc-binding metallopeptidase [Candidatus Sericytochromatia bacterium]
MHLVEKLYCFGVSYAGTNSRDAVYLDVGFNDIEKTFHHEVSSILLRNNSDKFDRYDWNKLSRGASTSSANAINHGLNSTKYNPELFSKGFLTDYSMSNAENDFNMYAENIFAGGKEFWDIVDSNPIVKEKTDIVINFYNKINPMFNEPYFRALAR